MSKIGKELFTRKRRSARVAASRVVAKKSVAKDDQGRADPISNDVEIMESADGQAKYDDQHETHILEMNDDCLREVFAHFDMLDLCAAKNSCSRFRDLAIEIVEKRFRFGTFDEYLRLPSKPAKCDDDFKEKALFAYNFGEYIRHIEISAQQKGSWRIGPVLKNCKSVESLRFRNVALGLVPAKKMTKMLGNINTLEFLRCRISILKMTRILRATKSLQHITIHGRMHITPQLFATIAECKELESIRLKVTGVHDINSQYLAECVRQLQTLPKLKQLEILYITRYTSMTETMDVFAQFESLETLTMSWFMPDKFFFEQLAKLPQLKVFTLHTYKDIKDKVLATAYGFQVTKKIGENRSTDGIENVPGYTHVFVPNN